MRQDDKPFVGSEDFTRSLEPSYDEPDKSNEPAKPANDVSEEKPKKDVVKQSVPPHHNPHVAHRRKRFELVSVIFLVVVIAIVVLLSYSTDSSPFLVLVSLLPTLFTIVVALIIYEVASDNRHILWVIPFVLAYVFHWYGKSGGGIVSGLDVDVLTALNVMLSFLYLIVNYFALPRNVPTRVVVKEAMLPADVATFIASIEDKSKALNFVIGRVYNAYHGGTKPLREKINMKQEWYDQFSQIPSDADRIDFVALQTLLSSIEKRLHQLEKTEREVFGTHHAEFKHLVRQPDGTDKIIDVLDKNDKDPVKSYYDGALQFCGKLRDFIKLRQVPEVENEYVERPPAKKRKKDAWASLKGVFRS